MSVAKITEIKVTSKVSFDAAIKEGVVRANKTLNNVKSAWIKDMEVSVGADGQITEYKVLMHVTFVLED